MTAPPSPTRTISLSYSQVPVSVHEVFGIPNAYSLVKSAELRPTAKMLYDIGLWLVEDEFKKTKEATARRADDSDDYCSADSSDINSITLLSDASSPEPSADADTERPPKVKITFSEKKIEEKMKKDCVTRLRWKNNLTYRCPTCQFKADTGFVMASHMETGHSVWDPHNRSYMVCCAFKHKQKMVFKTYMDYRLHMSVYHGMEVSMRAVVLSMPPRRIYDCYYCLYSSNIAFKRNMHSKLCRVVTDFSTHLKPDCSDQNWLFYMDGLNRVPLYGTLVKKTSQFRKRKSPIIINTRFLKDARDPVTGQPYATKDPPGKRIIVTTRSPQGTGIHQSTMTASALLKMKAASGNTPVVRPQISHVVRPQINHVFRSQMTPREVSSLNTPVVRPQINPVVRSQINPVVRPQINPVVRSQINPVVRPQMAPLVVRSQITPIIRPQMAPLEIRPLNTPVVRPQINPVVRSQINPVVRSQINPVVRSQINPVVRPHINPVVRPQMAPLENRPLNTPVVRPQITPVIRPQYTPLEIMPLNTPPVSSQLATTVHSVIKPRVHSQATPMVRPQITQQVHSRITTSTHFIQAASLSCGRKRVVPSVLRTKRIVPVKVVNVDPDLLAERQRVQEKIRRFREKYSSKNPAIVLQKQTSKLQATGMRGQQLVVIPAEEKTGSDSDSDPVYIPDEPVVLQTSTNRPVTRSKTGCATKVQSKNNHEFNLDLLESSSSDESEASSSKDTESYTKGKESSPAKEKELSSTKDGEGTIQKETSSLKDKEGSSAKEKEGTIQMETSLLKDKEDSAAKEKEGTIQMETSSLKDKEDSAAKEKEGTIQMETSSLKDKEGSSAKEKEGTIQMETSSLKEMEDSSAKEISVKKETGESLARERENSVSMEPVEPLRRVTRASLHRKAKRSFPNVIDLLSKEGESVSSKRSKRSIKVGRSSQTEIEQESPDIELIETSSVNTLKPKSPVTKQFVCELCNGMTRNRHCLFLHFLHRHKIQCPMQNSPKFTCNDCGKSFWTSQGFRLHSKYPGCEIGMRCPFCSGHFLKESIYSHVAISHERHFTTMFEKGYCLLCDNDDDHRLDLEEHWLEAHELQLNRWQNRFGQTVQIFLPPKDTTSASEHPASFVCPTCQASYPNRIRLRDHFIFSGHRLQCAVESCEERFIDRFTMTSHLTVDHADEERRCRWCPDFTATTAGKMSRHSREMHTKSVPQPTVQPQISEVSGAS